MWLRGGERGTEKLEKGHGVNFYKMKSRRAKQGHQGRVQIRDCLGWEGRRNVESHGLLVLVGRNEKQEGGEKK